ncbi:PAS domain S-box protein [Methanosphaerula subterraneus]|uniref:PAS domain S-box protein n=1 Tax=Methanosphaerula subterraneus TaxID=3350244 RepID=UPI003F86FB7A
MTDAGSQSTKNKISILYVDDEQDLLTVTRLFLERSGEFRVDTMASAQEALNSSDLQSYDVIISDYQMPGMDGIAFLKAIRERFGTLPFILFTGRGREEVVIDAINNGADFYIQKGGDPKSQFAELTHQIRLAVQRRRAEISIRDLERREADIINFLPDATYAIDRSGRTIAWNRALEEMTGVSAVDMLGKGDYEYAIPFYGRRQPTLIDLIYEMDEAVAKNYTHIAQQKGTLIADSTITLPTGKTIAFTGKASPLYNQQGEVVGAIETIRDITELKSAEESLRESEGRFAAFMEHLPVTAFIKDDQSTNLFVNRHMVEVFGEQDWIGTSVYSQFPQEAAEKMVEDDKQTLRDGYRKAIETLQGRDGTIKNYETYKFRIDRENKPPLIGGFAVDITDRKRAEDALRESEERYRNVVEDQTEFITRFLPDGTHVFVNGAYCRHYGLNRDEILGHRFRPELPIEDRERVKRFFESLTTDHPVDTIEHRIIMPDGTVRWHRWSDRAIFDPSGTIIEYQSVGLDITERKQKELALDKNEQHLISIYNTVEDSIFQLTVEPDRQYRFTSINAAFSRVTGLPHEQVIGKTVNKIIPEPSLSMVLEKYRQAIDEKTLVRWEETSHYPTGQLIGEVSITPIFDTGGRCTHLIGSVHDITERKRVEDALRESEERYRKIFENSPLGMALVTPDLRFVSVNPTWVTMTGYCEEELLQFSFKDITHPDHLAGDLEQMRELAAGTIPVYGTEKRYIRKDGSILWGLIRVTAIRDHQGAPGYFAAQIEDITERKRAEETLRQANEKLTEVK